MTMAESTGINLLGLIVAMMINNHLFVMSVETNYEYRKIHN